MSQMDLLRQDGIRAVSPMLELGAYETLWSRPETTFHRLAKRFRDRPGALPSDFVDHGEALEMARTVVTMLREGSVDRFDLRVHGTLEYPERLRDAKNPVEVLYFMGWWSLASTPCVAVVGARNPSEDGIRRARKLTLRLVADGWTIVSGLADGIDTAAHTAAIEAKGFTIGVLGTPLHKAYPRKNADLQKRLARDHLVISQVPVYRYSQEDYRANRAFFPQRNHTMAALAEATIIVEAGETSGTLIQGRGALRQGRRLFILDSCFRNPNLEWPRRLEAKGAIRIRSYEDIRRALPPPAHPESDNGRCSWYREAVRLESHSSPLDASFHSSRTATSQACRRAAGHSSGCTRFRREPARMPFKDSSCSGG